MAKIREKREVFHGPLTIYPPMESFSPSKGLFLEQARRYYQDKILAEAGKDEEKEELSSIDKSCHWTKIYKIKLLAKVDRV